MATPVPPARSTRRGPVARELEDSLRGVRALILDADGVILLKGEPLPGSIDALRALHDRDIPYRVVTNNSMSHRDTLAAWMRQIGVPAEPWHITTAASATAAYTRARFAGRPIVVITSADALREFEGQHLVPIEEAEARRDEIAAVVIGDAGEELSFGHLDTVFRLIIGGAEFLAMHRNPWWFTPRGMTLDSGAMVVGLEFATRRQATVIGKPSPGVFRNAFTELAAQVGGPRLRRADVAMVGDDLRSDIAPARRLGLRGIFVLSGKHGHQDVDRVRATGSRLAPDAVAGSLAEVVAALP
jgi:HAD superfamily hydrolase (TIGR01450 family)